MILWHFFLNELILAIVLRARKKCYNGRENEIEVHKRLMRQTSAQITRCIKDPIRREDHWELETPYCTVLLYMNIKNKF